MQSCLAKQVHRRPTTRSAAAREPAQMYEDSDLGSLGSRRLPGIGGGSQGPRSARPGDETDDSEPDMASDIWQFIHPERDALAADLAVLTDEEWAKPSLCDRWTVRDVLAHMTTAASMTPPRFILSLAGSGFSFDRYVDKEIDRHKGATPQETLERFRAAAHRTTSPPGPGETWMGETVVHGEDVRRPLGIAHAYDMDALRRIATFYAGSNLIIGAKRRVDGVHLRATDTDWAHGTGPDARGPMLSLVLAMTGRTAAIDDLEGEGVQLLRERS
jgi:uncharacterized protein (TIGR03083 family)